MDAKFELTQTQRDLLSAIRDRFSLEIIIDQYDLIDMRITATCLNDGKVYTTYRYFYDPNNHLVMTDEEFKATLDALFAYIILVYFDPEHENVDAQDCVECEDDYEDDDEEYEDEVDEDEKRAAELLSSFYGSRLSKLFPGEDEHDEQ